MLSPGSRARERMISPQSSKGWLIAPAHAYGNPWSIAGPRLLAQMTNLSAPFQTGNIPCAGRGIGGGTGGIGRCL